MLCRKKLWPISAVQGKFLHYNLKWYQREEEKEENDSGRESYGSNIHFPISQPVDSFFPLPPCFSNVVWSVSQNSFHSHSWTSRNESNNLEDNTWSRRLISVSTCSWMAGLTSFTFTIDRPLSKTSSSPKARNPTYIMKCVHAHTNEA